MKCCSSVLHRIVKVSLQVSTQNIHFLHSHCIYFTVELIVKEISYILYVHALMWAHQWRKNHALRMRNAILGNYLKWNWPFASSASHISHSLTKNILNGTASKQHVKDIIHVCTFTISINRICNNYYWFNKPSLCCALLYRLWVQCTRRRVHCTVEKS